MTPTVRTYYDADSTEGQPTYTPAGIGPSKVAERRRPRHGTCVQEQVVTLR